MNVYKYIMKKWFLWIMIIFISSSCAKMQPQHKKELALYEIKKYFPFGWVVKRHVRLTERQLDEIARRGIDLDPPERTILFYSMSMSRRRPEVSKAFIIKGKGEYGPFELAVNVDRKIMIRDIHMVKNPADSDGQPVITNDFIEQFIGMDLTSSFELVRKTEDVLTTPVKIKPIRKAPITSEIIAKELKKYLVIAELLKRDYPIWSRNSN